MVHHGRVPAAGLPSLIHWFASRNLTGMKVPVVPCGCLVVISGILARGDPGFPQRDVLLLVLFEQQAFNTTVQYMDILCHPSVMVSLFLVTFEAAESVPSVIVQPQKHGCHTLQRVDLARPFLVDIFFFGLCASRAFFGYPDGLHNNLQN